MNKNTIYIILAMTSIVGLLGLGKWNALRNPSAVGPKKLNQPLAASVLTTAETSYDFGSISMAKGVVSRTFKVKNTLSEPVTIDRVWTSCMCKTAILMVGGETVGPFGMSGHGAAPQANLKLDAGQEVDVMVSFDPVAHGPAGVGQIEREIYLETPSSEPLVLVIRANVTS